MKRKIYETPRTTYYSVEVEGSFAGSANVQNPDNATQGRIEEQGIATGWDDFSGEDYTFGGGSWTNN